MGAGESSDMGMYCQNWDTSTIYLPSSNNGYFVNLRWTNPAVPLPLNQIRLMAKKSTPPTSYNDPNVFLYESMPGGDLTFDNIPNKEQNVTLWLQEDAHWYFSVVYIDSNGVVVDEILSGKNLVDTVLGTP
jgi:hypothetical protein